MIALILFVAVFAQDQNEIAGCGAGMYFNINSGEGGKCETVNYCNETYPDNISGCKICGPTEEDRINGNYFNFRGQCYPCTCGVDEENNKIKCIDGVGCPKCSEEYVMVETKNADSSSMYTCTELPDTIPEILPGYTYTEYQLHGPDTIEFCEQWGDNGCTKCGHNGTVDIFYLNASMCYRNEFCSEVDENGVCTNCVQPSNSNDPSYYLLNGICTQCDGNCTQCDVNTGYCQECFPGYYPLDNKSKKCYQCDPNCDIESCVQLNNTENLPPGSCTKCRSDESLKETYYLVSNKYCIRMPTNCKAAETDKGCVECNEGYFLVPYHYNGINNFHYHIEGQRIGMCVPHQEACPEVNRTSTGCLGCSTGYVVDTVTWTDENGKEHTLNICSGAMSVMILALIAFLVLLF